MPLTTCIADFNIISTGEKVMPSDATNSPATIQQGQMFVPTVTNGGNIDPYVVTRAEPCGSMVMQQACVSPYVGEYIGRNCGVVCAMGVNGVVSEPLVVSSTSTLTSSEDAFIFMSAHEKADHIRHLAQISGCHLSSSQLIPISLPMYGGTGRVNIQYPHDPKLVFVPANAKGWIGVVVRPTLMSDQAAQHVMTSEHQAACYENQCSASTNAVPPPPSPTPICAMVEC
ncbi:unnamed protein product [Hydatigera taeniaeformis]|uniref:IgGFc_binding domain-containing protein n=1 Tax=Hydatigena taeniaeformis TaxID=6205 RepID=A0A0R3WNG2_HYDTA|nr:unnamed protein product [Hydatigera taeniaeformis]